MPCLVFDPLCPEIKEIEEKIAGLSSVKVELVHCQSALDAASYARRLEAAVVLAYLSSTDDLVKQLTMLRLLGQSITQKRVRVLVITKLQGDAILDKLEDSGATEIIPEPVVLKTLMYKLERHFSIQKTIITKAQAAQSKANQKKDDSSKKNSFLQNAKKARKEAKIDIVDPLELKSDFWSMGNGGAQRYGTRWSVNISGPGPEYGRWAQVANNEKKGAFFDENKNNSDPFWKWVPQNEDAENGLFPNLIQQEGVWIYQGAKPQYRNPYWSFVSKSPLLAFVHEGKNLGTRFRCPTEDEIQLTMDSNHSVESTAFLRKYKQEEEDRKKAEKLKNKNLLLKSGETGGPGGAGGSNAREVNLIDPLKIESDCWLLQDRNPRFVAGRWIIPLLGPGPGVGRWDLASTGAEAGKEDYQLWRWAPTDEKNPFIHEPGEWIFQGLQPKFQDDTWLLVGRAPKLSFIHEKQTLAERIKLGEDKSLNIAQDSLAAKRALPSILASFEKHIQSEGEEDEGSTDIKSKNKKRALVGDDPEDASWVENLTEPSDEVFRIDSKQFGRPPGRWHYVTADAKGGKWYVYLPPNVPDPNGFIVESLVPYWIFRGKSRPELKASEANDGESFVWEFVGAEPTQVPDLKSLPRALLDFLRELSRPEHLKMDSSVVNEDEVSESEEAEEGAGSNAPLGKKGKSTSSEEIEEASNELSLKDKKNRDSKELEIKLDPEKESKELSYEDKKAKDKASKDLKTKDEKRDSKELEIKLDDKKESKELSLEDKKNKDPSKELEIKLDDKKESKELSLEDKKNIDPSKDLEIKLDDKKESKELSLQDKLDDKKKPSSVGNAQPLGVANDKKGPDAVSSIKPGNKPLRIIALAFLMSELLWRKDTDLKEKQKKYCKYLSASFGVPVEFWGVQADGKTVCINDEQPHYSDVSMKLKDCKEPSKLNNKVWVIPLIDQQGFIGALVFSADLTVQIDHQYFLGLSKISKNLFSQAA